MFTLARRLFLHLDSDFQSGRDPHSKTLSQNGKKPDSGQSILTPMLYISTSKWVLCTTLAS